MGFKLGKNKVKKISEYIYYPKNRDELQKILEERLKKDKNANLNDIDVSNIIDMSFVFSGLDPYNIDISEWDVSNVKIMKCMFDGCKNFNCDLSTWDVSNVEDMYSMFYDCKSFEGKGLENWNVKNVKHVNFMFHDCYSVFDFKNMPSWYTTKIKYI